MKSDNVSKSFSIACTNLTVALCTKVFLCALVFAGLLFFLKTAFSVMQLKYFFVYGGVGGIALTSLIRSVLVTTRNQAKQSWLVLWISVAVMMLVLVSGFGLAEDSKKTTVAMLFSSLSVVYPMASLLYVANNIIEKFICSAASEITDDVAQDLFRYSLTNVSAKSFLLILGRNNIADAKSVAFVSALTMKISGKDAVVSNAIKMMNDGGKIYSCVKWLSFYFGYILGWGNSGHQTYISCGELVESIKRQVPHHFSDRLRLAIEIKYQSIITNYFN